ncbi:MULTISPECIES: hypothetical protein [unclassified Treponema]|uniref:hypothetical protein n=1 Tax=unclassified Treponema TaxID=2638727 RepID=UPI0020A57189|nr:MULTISPECIES: hypothetical protein [unclassified Treponema]UTC66174.1 hypothetical protein E4O06_09145 [Treponema sp. OMZ 789]UTC68903.1 hypothetical protein E4O01_09280 [Treponema sp. OMZ 790]UTC71631.1 hypothetical protein E4O02_09470 [Treponema sp. OMZ 791]
MRKVFFVMTVLAVIFIGFTSCSQPIQSAPPAVNGESDKSTPPPAVPKVIEQKELYGSYWGDMQVGPLKPEMCIVLKADKIELHSNIMGKDFPFLIFKDEGNGIWTVNCYDDQKNKDNKPNVRLTIDTTKKPFSCKAWIEKMGTEGNCVKGKNYNNDYGY